MSTKNIVDNILAIANKELGTHEKNGGDDKYIAWYGGFALNVAWCAIFVSWVMNKAGVPTTVVPKFASCDTGMQWFIKKGLFKPNTMYGGKAYTPKPGDIIFFSSKFTMKDSTHVGIVVSHNKGTVTTIEGNTSDQVANRTYTVDNKRILGYATPQYTTTHSVVPKVPEVTWLTKLQKAVGAKDVSSILSKTPTLKVGSRGEVVKLLQERLNYLGFKCGNADGIFGANTKIAVEAFQLKVLKFKYPDGIVDSGKNTWKALINS